MRLPFAGAASLRQMASVSVIRPTSHVYTVSTMSTAGRVRRCPHVSWAVNRTARLVNDLYGVLRKNPVAAIGWLRHQELTGHRRPARIVGRLGAGCREVDADVARPARQGKAGAHQST